MSKLITILTKGREELQNEKNRLLNILNCEKSEDSANKKICCQYGIIHRKIAETGTKI